MPEPAALVHPPTVCVTVYVPAVVTVIEAVVAPLLHNIVPPAGIDKVEVPQLFTTVTTGVAGAVFGAAMPEPAALVQPFTVCVTLNVPALLTVIDEPVEPVLHNKLPPAVVDKVDVPLQLFTTVTIGVAGVVFGAAVPVPAALVQLPTVDVTVYVPAALTMIDEPVEPVLHNKLPPAVVDKVDVPLQLSTTFTTGVAGPVPGAAVPEPATLVQPFTVCVTLNVPLLLTVIVEPVEPVLHNKLPPAVVDKVDVPLQLFTTVTTGVAGVVFGAAMPVPAALVQLPTVVVTVYVPAVLTMIDEPVEPVLHNKLPPDVVDKVDVPLQLSTTVTTGVAGAEPGAAMPEPGALVQPFTVCVTLNVPPLFTVIDEPVEPVLHNKLPPAVVDKVDVPLQLFTTVTIGVAGGRPGAAVPEPAALVQPPTVVVTVYVPAVLTVIDEPIEPVLHNKLPPAVVDKVDVLLQLSTTVTTGVAGIGLWCCNA